MRSRFVVAAVALIGLATAFAEPTAEELLRGVQADAPPRPAAPARSAETRERAKARARAIVSELQQKVPAAKAGGGLKTQTAEELLRGAQGGKVEAPKAADTFFDAPARASRGNLLKPVVKKADSLERYFVDAQKGAEYAGTDKCLECHRAYGEEGRASLSALYALSSAILVDQRKGCEGCHGPGSKHVEGRLAAITNPRKLTKMGQADLCFSCHAVTVRAGDPVRHFPGHSANHVSCSGCHQVHQPKAEKFLKEEPNRLCISCHRDVATEFNRRSKHPIRPEEPSPRSSQRGGKMRCIDCHRAWHRRDDPNGRQPNVATCQGCHAETRGPFLFPHDAGSQEMTNGCQACHLPHGSPNRHLLRANGRSLCLSCHSDFATGHFPAPTCTTTACHQDIHGSNANVFLLR